MAAAPRSGRFVELALPVTFLAAPLLSAPTLPAPWSLLLLLALGLLWFWQRPPRREVIVASGSLLVVLLALAARGAAERTARAAPEQWLAEGAAEREYAELWR